jgi:hypothetical protein
MELRFFWLLSGRFIQLLSNYGYRFSPDLVLDPNKGGPNSALGRP